MKEYLVSFKGEFEEGRSMAPSWDMVVSDVVVFAPNPDIAIAQAVVKELEKDYNVVVEKRGDTEVFSREGWGAAVVRDDWERGELTVIIDNFLSIDDCQFYLIIKDGDVTVSHHEKIADQLSLF